MKNSVKVRAGLVTILLAALVSCKGNDTMEKGTDAEEVNGGVYSDTTTVVPMNDSLTSPGNNGGMNNNGTGGTGSGTNGTGSGSNGTGTNQSGTNGTGSGGTGTNKSGTNNNGAGVSGEGSTGTTNTNPRP